MPYPTKSFAKALITGSNGFVGEYLTAALQAADTTVVGCGDQATSALPIAYRQLDITQAEQVNSVIQFFKPDVIFHLAGISSVKLSLQKPELTHAVNVDGTRHLLGALRKIVPQAKVVIVSSSEVYKPKAEPLVETDPLDGTSSPYAQSRVDQEALCRADFADVDWVLSRSFNHIGPKQLPHFVIADFARQVAAIRLGLQEPVIAVGNLEVVRDFTDVRDMVQAYRLLATLGDPGEVYNLGSGQGAKVSDLLAKLILLAGKPVAVRVSPDRFRPSDNPIMICHNAKFVTLTRWHLQYSLEQTLQDIFDYSLMTLKSQKG